MILAVSALQARFSRRGAIQIYVYLYLMSELCRAHIRTHVARKHVSRTSNNVRTHMYRRTQSCRRIARSGYMLTVSRRHNYYSFVSRSTCIPFYPATDRRQTGDNFVIVADTRNMLTATSGYNLYPATWLCPGVNAALCPINSLYRHYWRHRTEKWVMKYVTSRGLCEHNPLQTEL